MSRHFSGRRLCASTAVLLACGLTFTPISHAEAVPGTSFALDLQSAQITAAGRTINLFRAPVTDTATGITTFYDASFLFGVLPDGSLGFSRVSSVASSTSALRSADNFAAGTYKDGAGNTFTVSGPVVLAGGRFSYAISCTSPGKVWTATWITGPVSGHPNVDPNAAIKPADGAAGAFGLFGTSNYNVDNLTWTSGRFIGATQQSASVITITHYSAGAVPLFTSAFTRSN